jgi:uncharacterized protein (DUF952 family)
MNDARPLYHIAPARDIERAARSGTYAPPTLEREGFIHCSYASQVAATADRIFRGQPNLLVLEIDPSRLASRVVAENLDGGAELFPHVYGSLPMSAVLAIRELRCRPDGTFEPPCMVAGHEHATSTDLDEYFDRYFVDAHRFAALCGIELDELRDLIRRKLVPAPSYVVRDDTIRSFVFGDMAAPGARSGEYFRAENVDWVVGVRHDLATHGVAGATERARHTFSSAFAAALRELNASTHRMDDAFDDAGNAIQGGLAKRLESAWEHFLHGTFGLCVADPGSVPAIARKEVLQERLAALTNNGSRRSFAADEARALRTLIDAYAGASMPFSPIEYARSSRKRLVDDLRAHLGS